MNFLLNLLFHPIRTLGLLLIGLVIGALLLSVGVDLAAAAVAAVIDAFRSPATGIVALVMLVAAVMLPVGLVVLVLLAAGAGAMVMHMGFGVIVGVLILPTMVVLIRRSGRAFSRPKSGTTVP